MIPITAGAPRNSWKKALRENMLHTHRVSVQVMWGCSSVVIFPNGAPENPQKTCSSWNPAPARNPGLKAPFFKVLNANYLKIKNKPNPETLNFVSIQWNYLQASPISRDYPFNWMLKRGACELQTNESQLPYTVSLSINVLSLYAS
jgi:hypothetical protein